MSALISAIDISLSYGAQNLLNGVSLTCAAGEKVGLVGRNGSGKTSLFQILAGLNAPDSGEIALKRGLRVAILPQEFELNTDLSIQENILAGVADIMALREQYEKGDASEAKLAEIAHEIEHCDGWNVEIRMKSIASALGIPDLELNSKSLSGGEKRRVALAQALISEPDLLLLDEPTNHLDSESIRWLEDFLNRFQGAVIFITHDRYFLDRIATRIIELSDGKCYSHPGNYTAFLEDKALRQQIAEQTERRRQRFLREELEWVRAGVKARTTKSRHRLDQFYAIAGLEAPPEEREMDLLLPPPPDMGNIGVELEDVGYRLPSGRWLFRHLTASIRPKECTGIVGPNGVGKTTLLKICLGQLEPTEGKVTIGKRIVTNYIDQLRADTQQSDAALSILNFISNGQEKISFGNLSIYARSYLKRFLFADDRLNERVEILSGGERARLMLARELKNGGNFIILDEPTNDLDLASLRLLEEALVDFAGAVIAVSHDRYFLDRITDQIIAFEPEGIQVQTGNYSYYLEKRAIREESYRLLQRQMKSISQPKQSPQPTSNRRSWKEEREWESIEETILEAEEVVSQLENLLNDSQYFVEHYEELAKTTEKLTQATKRVSELYARWEELAEKTPYA